VSSRRPTRAAPVWFGSGDDLLVAILKEKQQQAARDRARESSEESEVNTMSDTKKNATSPEYAEAKKAAHVPEVTPEHTPEKVGQANSQQFNQGKK
jgi:hypothetical protein